MSDKKILLEKLTNEIVKSNFDFIDGIKINDIEIIDEKLNVGYTLVINEKKLNISEETLNLFVDPTNNEVNQNYIERFLNSDDNNSFKDIKNELKKCIGFFYNVKHKNYTYKFILK